MKKEDANSSISIPNWGVLFVLLATLYLMYSPGFTFDYLMNDETYEIGSTRNPLREVYRYFFINGRSLYGLYSSLVYRFSDYDPIKIQFVRFVNFASVAAIACLLCRFLWIKSKNIYLSFFIIIFYFSQLSFQGIIGYSFQLISNSQPSMWLSLLAFYLHFYFFPKRKIRKWIAYGATFFVFMAAMQSTQTYAYFCMVPLSYLVLTEGKRSKQQIHIFFALALASFIFSILLFKIGLEISHWKAYHLGTKGMVALTSSPLKVLFIALNPKSYWSAFKFWTYPYPFHYTLPMGSLKPIIAAVVMAVWFGLTSSAFVKELSACQMEEKRHILLKWFWALLCLGFGALFIIADSPLRVADHRPHMTVTFVGVCIFVGAYALQVLSSSYKILQTTLAKGIGIFLVILTAFGAQTGLLRGVVDNRQDQIDFIRTELSSKNPNDYEKIIVVLPSSNTCVTEPCNRWFGHVVHGNWHQERKGRYKYALRTLGISPNYKEIVFLKSHPKQVAQNELIIDWEKYITARKRHRDYLHKRR